MRLKVKERRGYSHLKTEALDRTMWRARFGRGFGPLVRQTTKWNECTVLPMFVCKYERIKFISAWVREQISKKVSTLKIQDVT